MNTDRHGQTRTTEKLVGAQGGYRKLKSFQIAQLIYDMTVRFCELYIDKHSRTNDQMVQAARSGVQNIAEGSQCAGTSKKFEIKLTNVARASLAALAANAALSLLNLCCYPLDRQISSQSQSFEENGGFTERMHRVRSNNRRF